MSGIGIILNPHSKQHKKDPDKGTRMSFIVGDKASCKETSDLDDLRRVVEEFKTRDIEILAISGGDGTNHRVLTEFIHIYGEKHLPKIALLRGGTMNTVANGLNIRGSSEKLLSNLITKYHENLPFEEQEVDMIRINSDFGFLFGNGLIYRFLEAYYNGVTPSPPKAAFVLLRAIFSSLFHGKFGCHLFKRFDAEVEVDGEPWPFKNYIGLLCGSVPELGLKSQVFYHSHEPRRFHGFGFSTTPRAFLANLYNIVLGRKNKHPDILDASVSNMKIKLAEPLAYTIDGDMLDPLDEFDLGVGPRLTVIK